jgi:SAM-dependent methyltransferase
MQLSAEAGNRLFADVAKLDRDDHLTEDYLDRWLFVEHIKDRPHIKEMSFFEYAGPEHLLKFFNWIDKFPYSDWFVDARKHLVAESVRRDLACLDALGLARGDLDIEAVGLYNAQDYLLQRFYPVPDRQQPRVILDFGAGHGRMANLAFRSDDDVTETMIAVDGIPSSYLTQRAYYSGLGLGVADYLEARIEGQDFDVAKLQADHDVVHLPTWRLDLVPDQSVDLVCCVQVLKELPRKLVLHVLEEFARVVKPGGAIYVRDHTLHHHPNMLPIDQLLLANGFVLEFAPQVRDRVDIHGLPRVWRRLDPELLHDIPRR